MFALYANELCQLIKKYHDKGTAIVAANPIPFAKFRFNNFIISDCLAPFTFLIPISFVLESDSYHAIESRLRTPNIIATSAKFFKLEIIEFSSSNCLS